MSVPIAISGFFGGLLEEKPLNLGAFGDPFVSIQLAPSPNNGDCLTTDGTDNIWDTCASGGASVFGDLGDVSTSTDATGDIYYLNSLGQITNLNAGSNGEVLKLSGGLPSWGTDNTGGGGTPGGSATQVQFNDYGSFGGDNGLTYSTSTDELTATNLVTTNATGTNSTSTNLSVSDSFDFLGTIFTDLSSFLFETELDTFSELQTQIADKTLVNEEDSATFDSDMTFSGVINANGTIDIDDLFILDGANLDSVNRLRIQGTGANDPVEVFLQPKGSSNNARLSIGNDSSTTNYADLELQVHATTASINSTSTGNGTTLPLELQIDGNGALTIDTSRNIAFDAYTTEGFLTNDTSGNLTSSTSISANFIEDAYLLNTGDTATGNYTFDTDTFFIDASNNRVGVGTTTPQARLDVAGALGSQASIFRVSSTTDTGFFEALTVDSDGNTTHGDPDNSGDSTLSFEKNNAPVYTIGNDATNDWFTIAGSGVLGTSNRFTINADTATTTVSDRFVVDNSASDTSPTFFLDLVNDRLGINTQSPDESLTVATGNLKVTAGNSIIGGTGTSTYAGDVDIAGDLEVGSLSGFLKATAGFVATALIDLANDVEGILPDANVANDITILGGTINDTAIGASTPSTGVFTNSTSTNATSTNFHISGNFTGGAGGSDTQLQFNNSGNFDGAGINYVVNGSGADLNFSDLDFLKLITSTDSYRFVDLTVNNTSTSESSYIFMDNAGLFILENDPDGLFEFSNGTNSGILDFSNVATSDKTFTFPNLSGTIALSGAAQSLDFSTATVKQHTYPKFSWPGSATTTAATSTVPMGQAMVAEQWNFSTCRVTSGSSGYEFTDGTNATEYRPATTTASRFAISTNNTFVVDENQIMSVGALTNAQIVCGLDITVNN